MLAFGKLMEMAEEVGLIEGFKIGREKVTLSHLQFADDSIFLKRGLKKI